MVTTTRDRSSEKKRLPRLERVDGDSRPPVRFTARDLAAIDAVWRYRALTAPQLATLLFNGNQRLRVCQRRLQRLYHHGYLARVQQPAIATEGSKPFLYLLDRDGARLLAEKRGLSVAEFDWKPSDNAAGAPYLQHLLATNDLRIAVTLAARSSGWLIDSWVDDTALRRRHTNDYVTLRGRRGRVQRAAVLPDGYFRLITPADSYNFFLEIDMRTVTAQAAAWGKRDWARKVAAYLAYHASGAYERRYGTSDLRILTVTTGAKRLAHLKQITEEIGNGARATRFWFSTFGDAVAEAVLVRPIWQVAGLPEPHALISATT